MAKTARGADQAMIRLPDGLRDRIKAEAEANNRSMNAEIVSTLEERYPAPTVLNTFDIGYIERAIFEAWQKETDNIELKSTLDKIRVLDRSMKLGNNNSLYFSKDMSVIEMYDTAETDREDEK